MAATATAVVVQVNAQTTPPTYAAPSGLPSMRLIQGSSLVAPSAAQALYAQKGSIDSAPAPVTSMRISALAKGLENNPDRIYAFVRDNIEFEPLFGLHKGADGVLMDRSGGAFDQAQLMVELLRAAGYEARYVLGRVSLGADATEIFKTDNANQTCVLLASAGVPATVNGQTSCASVSGALSSVDMTHLWVEARIGGQWWAFDPALKRHDKTVGVDLWAAMGTSAASAWSDLSSGVSSGQRNLTGLNPAQINTKLDTYTLRLHQKLTGDDSDKSLYGKKLEELTGGWSIRQTASTSAPLRVAALSYSAERYKEWAGDIPAPFRAKLRIRAAGFDTTYDLPSIYGDRIQAQMYGKVWSAVATRMPFDNTPTTPVPCCTGPSEFRFKLAIRRCEHVNAKATAYFTEPETTCEQQNTTVGSALTQEATASWDRKVLLGIDHPYVGAADIADETVAKTVEVGRRMDVIVRLGGGTGARYDGHRAAVDPHMALKFLPEGMALECEQYGTMNPNQQPQAGECDDKRAEDWNYFLERNATFATGERAAVEMAAKKDHLINLWASLFDRTTRLLEPVSGSRIVHHHSLGLSLTPEYAENSLDIETAVAVASTGAYAPHQVLGTLSAFASAQEGAALYQIATERDGSVREALRPSYPLAENSQRRLGMSASTGLTVLRPGETSALLPAGVQAAVRTEVDRYLLKGFSVVVASRNGGDAFFARRGDGAETAWMIYAKASSYATWHQYDPQSAFRKGAETSRPNPHDHIGDQEKSALAKNVTGAQMGAVDLNTGGLSFGEAPDVTVGQGEFPYSLTFQRSYSSSGPVEGPTELGAGWSHNWTSSQSFGSDAAALMSDNDPASAAPTLAAMLFALEAAKQNTIEASVVSGVVMTWWSDLAGANTLQLSGGGSSGRFVRQVGGTWRNPSAPAERVTILPAALQYDRTLSDGSVQQFRPVAGKTQTGQSRSALTKWIFPSGVVIDLAYTGADETNDALLTQVSNNLGVALTLEYVRAPTAAQTNGCNYAAGLSDSAEARLQGWQDCYVAGQAGGKLKSVRAGSDTSTFEYWSYCRINTNLCYFGLERVIRTGERTRRYYYTTVVAEPTPGGALSGPLMTSIADEGVATPRAQFVWDGAGGQVRPHVLSAKDAQARTTEYYSAGAYQASVKDAAGNIHRTVFDEDGRILASLDPLQRVTRAAYDGYGRTASVISAWGDRTEFKYDSRGNMIEKTKRPSAAVCAAGNTDPWWCQTIAVTAEYHPTWNKPTKVTIPAVLYDPVQRSYDYVYNSQGLVSELREPEVWDGVNGRYDRPVWKTWYDSFGRVTRSQDPTGIESLNAYGENGQPAFCLTSTTQSAQLIGGLNLKARFTCNAVGDVLSVTDPRGNVTTTSYDALRRKLETVGPAGTNIRTQWVYDLDGYLTDEKRWDATAGLWRTTTMTYSATGKPLTVTDPDGDVARSCYDALDRVIVAVDGENRAVKTVYDAAGSVLRVEKWWKAAAGDACALTADLPAGQTNHAWRTYEYNAGGLVAAEIDANGNRTDHQYEGLGRLIITYYPDSDGAGPKVRDQENFLTSERGTLVYKRHRAPGNVTSEMTQYWYDPVGRQRHSTEFTDGTTWPQGRNVRRSYDLAGRPVFADVSQQATATWSDAAVKDLTTSVYDKAGRLSFEHNYLDHGANPSLYKTVEYGYDAAGNRTSIKWPDAWTATFGYDAANRLQTTSFPGGSATYAYDSLSRRTSVTRSNGTSTSYTWQADGDLTSTGNSFAAGSSPTAFSFDYGYNKAGQITSKGVTGAPQMEWMPTLASARTYGAVNPLNQLSTANSVELRFDQRGNLCSEGGTDCLTGAVRYEHDIGNRLIKFVKTGVGATTATYVYDADDRRTLKTVNGVVTRTLWSGADELAQTDVAGTILRRFIPGAAVDDRLAVVEGATVKWLHVDLQGSVVAVSNATGKVTATATYSPTGQHDEQDRLSVDLSMGVPFGYTGREYDTETGLYYYRARYYTPRLGQYLETDPIGTADNPNLYLYAGLDPARKTDPSGRQDMSAEARREIADNRILEECGTQACVAERTAKLNEKDAEIASLQLDVMTALFGGPAVTKAFSEGLEALAKYGDDLAQEIGIVRQARSGADKGNYGLGSVTREQSDRIGEGFVGEGAAWSTDRKALVSADKLRQYRPPSTKKSPQAKTGVQSNLQSRDSTDVGFQNNGHLDITD